MAEQKNQDLNQLLKIRRDKLAELQANGKDPFQITKFNQTHHSLEVKNLYEAHEAELLKDRTEPDVTGLDEEQAKEVQKNDYEERRSIMDASPLHVAIAGRMMFKRVMGKASFCNIQDLQGNIQVYVARDAIGADSYADFKKSDIGDIFGLEGFAFRTRTGEISIHAEKMTLLSKSLQILPEKFHGLTDTDMRYRQRYVDLIMNQDSKNVFIKRSQILKEIRNFLADRDFMEVETPMLVANAGGAAARPFETHYNALNEDVLEPGDSAAFTAVPVTGLKVGNYLDSIQIAQTSSEGQEDVLTTIKASATVSEVKKIYKLSVTPEELNFGKAKEGYSEAPEAQKVTVTNEGNTNVTLNAPSGKNFKIGKLSATELAPGESCTFKIRPKEGLKAGSYTESVVIDNEQQISAEVKVQFTVKAARKAKIADPADNKITGISSDGYTTQSKITFTAVGAGMDNESPGKGDVRYVPYNWKVINTNSWSSAPYTAAFGITKAGTYTLTVTFDRQKYNGSEWENTGEQDTKQVNFSITQAQTVTATPTPQPNGASAKSAVKTGDTTNITPFVIILAIAAGCIVGVVVRRYLSWKNSLLMRKHSGNLWNRPFARHVRNLSRQGYWKAEILRKTLSENWTALKKKYYV